MPRILSAQSLDTALSVITLSIGCNFIRTKSFQFAPLLIAALFFAITILNHNLLLAIVVIGTWIFYGLFQISAPARPEIRPF